MDTKTSVWITFSFPALHQWENAFDLVHYLKHPHRHVFHVKMKWTVNHDDRDIEFINMKNTVERFIDHNWKNQNIDMSCEMIARHLLEKYNAVYVSVSEDKENGAEITRI